MEARPYGLAKTLMGRWHSRASTGRNGGEALRPREATNESGHGSSQWGRNGGEALRPREVPHKCYLFACGGAAMEARPYGLAKLAP